MKKISTHLFSTGVKRDWLSNDQLPSLAVWDSRNIMVFPFQCENVPANSSLLFITDDPTMQGRHNVSNIVIRKILPGSGLVNEYAYFRTN